MQYFGIPTCPYCKKRVNLIRTWSLKKQGEFQCPRCGGISNIYLSPLIYVLALLALATGGAVYFFHKFVLDDISLETALQVFLPFAVFFLLSVFFVYLAKPIIKKVSREEMNRKKFGRKAKDQPLQTSPAYFDREDYPPQPDQFTAPAPTPAPAPPRPRRDPGTSPVRQRPAAPAPLPESQQPIARRLEAAANPIAPHQPAPVQQPRPLRQPAPMNRQGAVSIRPPVPVNRRPAPLTPPAAPAAQMPQQAQQAVSSVEPPKAADDFFAKYDDPEYVQRRLREMKGRD